MKITSGQIQSSEIGEMLNTMEGEGQFLGFHLLTLEWMGLGGRYYLARNIKSSVFKFDPLYIY